METGKRTKEELNKILSSSYIFYVVLLFTGLTLDLIFPAKFFNSFYTITIGLFFVLLGTFLIFWSKIKSTKAKKEFLTGEDFRSGPYRFTSIPNHWGIFFLILGFGVIINAPFTIALTICAFLITLPFFLKMQKNVLVEKYGAPYLEYKKKVKF